MVFRQYLVGKLRYFLRMIAMMPKYMMLFAIVLSLPMATAADFKKTWDNAANRRITVSTLHGDIKLIGYDGKDIEISAVKKGHDRDRVEIQDASSGNQINIYARYLESTRNNATVDFEIRVPKEFFYNAAPIAKPQPQGVRGSGLPFPKFPGETSASPVIPQYPNPKSTASSKEPAVSSPKTAVLSPKPEAASKGATASSTESAVLLPKPEASSKGPAASSTESAVLLPKPETSSKEPAASSTEAKSPAPGAKLSVPGVKLSAPGAKTQVPKTPPPGIALYPGGSGQSPQAIYLKSNSGQITISDVAGSIRLETGSRNIEIHNVEGMLTAISGSGDIKGVLKQTSTHRSELQLSSTSGNISVQAPADVSALVYIQSATGQVKTDFPLETRDMRYAGKFIQGKLGAGSQRLTARSVSGAIHFTKKPSEKSEKPEKPENNDK